MLLALNSRKKDFGIEDYKAATELNYEELGVESDFNESDVFVGRAIQTVKKFKLANGRQVPKVVFMLAATLLRHNHLEKE